MTFGGLDSLFNPAKQHMEEEKLRLQSTREEVGDASGGKRIDLDSGRVRLNGRRAGDADPSADSNAGVDADADPAAHVDAGEVEVDPRAIDGSSPSQKRRSSGQPNAVVLGTARPASKAAQRARERRRKPSPQ